MKLARGFAPLRWFAFVASEQVLSILVVALVILQIARLVDWQTVTTLAGLLMVTKALELSGFLMWLAHRIVHHVRSDERSLAMLRIVFAAPVLVTLLTNDVTLFVAVPLVGFLASGSRPCRSSGWRSVWRSPSTLIRSPRRSAIRRTCFSGSSVVRHLVASCSHWDRSR